VSNEDIIRAWKDEDYWENLDAEKRSQLPEHPAGIIELSQEEMEIIQGGAEFAGGVTGCLCPGSVQYTCGIVCIPSE
jgi:mersacidin/lichenicidin family type 2 lantibiotic